MTSADRRFAVFLLGLGCVPLALAEPEVPGEPADAEFIEYLGMWAQTDEDWLLLDEVVTADADERSDPAPEGEESTETEDES